VILVDTNVISTLMRPEGAELEGWFREAARESLYLSSVTVVEITYGVHLLPVGSRRQRLDEGWQSLQTQWHGRILPVTPEIAEVAGVTMAARRSSGHRLDLPDALIAATCLLHRCSLATRNIRDFDGLGVELINPWSDLGR